MEGHVNINHVSSDEKVYGTELTAYCQEGYAVGNQNISFDMVCNEDAEWEPGPEACECRCL